MPSSRRRPSKSGSSRGRCLQPGPIGRNPYLNFLRVFRKQNCGLSPVETVRQGAKEWKRLSNEDKLHYIKEAFYAPKRRRSMSSAMCGPVVRRRLKLLVAKIGALQTKTNTREESNERMRQPTQITMAECRPIRKSTRMARKGRVPKCPTTTTQMSDSKLTEISAENPKNCMSPGPVQRNPFLNFLREYRKNNCGLTAVETVRQGAKAWKSLPKEEKIRYIVEAFYAPKRRRRNSKALCGPAGRRMARHRGKVRKRSQSARSRRSSGKKRRPRSARRGRVC